MTTTMTISTTNTTNSLELSGQPWNIDASLQSLIDAKNDPNISMLQLTDFDFDVPTAAVIVNLLKCDHRIWESLTFQECSGHLDIVLTVAIATDRLRRCFIYIARTEYSPCFHALGVGLRTNNSLEELTIQTGSNVFFSLPVQDATLFAEGLAGNTTLQKLGLKFCRFEPGSVRAFTQGLRANKHIQDLRLPYCFVTSGNVLADENLAEIIQSLESSTNLKTLDLSGNKCLSGGLTAIANLLDQIQLERLNLSCQFIENNEAFDIVQLVGPMTRNTTLKHIDLRFNKLNNNDMAYLAATLSHNTSIEYVGLASNKISNAGIQVLASRIPEMKGLKRLNLSGNHFDGNGVLAMANALHHNEFIEDIIFEAKIENHKLVQYYTDLNWGGRKLLKIPGLPPGIWLPVFVRVNTLEGSADWIERCADIFYYLLRECPILTKSQDH